MSNGAAAQSQMTTQMLIGDSVSEVGTRYGDVDEAIKRFMNRDVLAARQFLESAKKKDAQLPPVELMLAKMYFLTNNAAPGRASLERTALDNPEDPEPSLLLADQALQGGRAIEAEALYEKALALNAKFNGNAKRKRNFEIRGRGGRAAINGRRKNWEAAAADLKELLKLDPDNANFHARLGQALFMQKQFQDGYNEFAAAKKLDKNSPDPNLASAALFDQLKMPDKAQLAFDKALAANKTDPDTITNYAQWLIRSGTPEAISKAEAVLADARKANAGNLNLLILSGVAAHMQKKMKPAEDYFLEAHGIAPQNSDVINQLALILIEQQDPAKRQRGLQYATMSAQMNAQNPDAQITLAWVLYQLQRNAEAEQVLRNTAQLGNPSSPDASYLVAKMFSEQNQNENAKKILQQAFENDATGIFVYKNEAQALMDKLK
jgi:tetratricopeptide (TPR) repeat protein